MWKNRAYPRKDPTPRLGGEKVDLTSTGSLDRTSNGIRGELSDLHGWRMALTARDGAGGALLLTGTTSRMGRELPPWIDGNLRCALADDPDLVLTGRLERAGQGWSGTLGTAGVLVELTAEPAGPGRLILRGVG